MHLDLIDRGLLLNEQGERMTRAQWTELLAAEVRGTRLTPEQIDLRRALGVRGG